MVALTARTLVDRKAVHLVDMMVASMVVTKDDWKVEKMADLMVELMASLLAEKKAAMLVCKMVETKVMR